jgi:hypothetical protein
MPALPENFAFKNRHRRCGKAIFFGGAGRKQRANGRHAATSSETPMVMLGCHRSQF